MAIENQNLSSLSPNVVVGDPDGPLGRNSGEIESVFHYQLCKTNPISERVKLLQSVYLKRIMKKYAAKGYAKTNPIKPNFKPNDGFSPQVRLSAWGRLTVEAFFYLLLYTGVRVCTCLGSMHRLERFADVRKKSVRLLRRS